MEHKRFDNLIKSNNFDRNRQAVTMLVKETFILIFTTLLHLSFGGPGGQNLGTQCFGIEHGTRPCVFPFRYNGQM